MKRTAFLLMALAALIGASAAAADQTTAGNLGKPDQVLRVTGTNSDDMVSTALCPGFAPGDELVFTGGTFAEEVRFWSQSPLGVPWRVQITQIDEPATVGGLSYALNAHLSFDGAAENDEIGNGKVTITRSDGQRMTGQASLFVDPVEFATGFGYVWSTDTVRCH